MKLSRERVALTALLVVVAGLQAAQEPSPGKNDWPQWQGPTRQANCTESGLVETWPTDGPPLLWTTKNLGTGFSTPCVAAGKIYGMSQRGNQDGVWCLDEATGKEQWFTSIGNAARVDYGGSRCTPTVDGDRLYALTVGGELACLDSQTGKLQWKKSLPTDFGGRMMSGWGFSESPLVDGDKLICTPGNPRAAVVALNKKTGGVIWKSAVEDCGGAAYASLVVSEACGIRHYVTFLGRCLVGIDAKTGKMLWRFDRVANKTANCSTAIVKDDYVFASSAYNTGSALLKISKKGQGLEAKQVYFLDSRTFQNHHGGIVLVGDHIYGGHGQNRGEPTCIDFLTGKVVWKERSPGRDSAAVLAAGDNLIFRYQDGTMALIAADPAKFTVKAKFKLPEDSGQPSWPHPIIANGRMYIREQNALMCFNVKAKDAEQ